MKLLLTLAIAFLGFASYGQDTTAFVPNYGIELGSHFDKKIFGTDTTRFDHVVKFMYAAYTETGVQFVYDIKTYVDSVQVNHENRLRVALPLNATIQGKKVWEWLNQTVPKLDTTIYKGLATELYKRKVLNK